MRAAACPERVVRPREPELREEQAGHRFVPVLAGVHEDLVMAGPKGGLQRGGLDELGSRPYDADDLHPDRVAGLSRAGGQERVVATGRATAPLDRVRSEGHVARGCARGATR